jgi:tetratricopeptide (TPR) repeat protein
MLRRLAPLAAGLALVVPATALAAGPTAGHKAQCLGAQELQRLGRDADAQALYLQLVKARVPCKGTAAALHPSWPRRVTQFVSAWWSFALYAALVAGLVFAFLTRLRPVRGGLRRVPIAGFFFQPRVAVGTFDSSAEGTLAFGMASTALVDTALRRFVGDSLTRVNHIAVSTGAESASATVAKLGDLGTEFKAVAAVMTFLGRVSSTPVYQLSGTLQPDGGDGLGVSLALDERLRAVDATTLRVKAKQKDAEDDTGRIQALEQLSSLAAAWVDYAMRKDELPQEFEYPVSPKSYAELRVGVLHALQGEPELAKNAYERALAQDRGNVGALVNLAAVLRRRRKGWKPRYGRAEALLDQAYIGLKDVPDRSMTFIWYQVLYGRLALWGNWSSDTGLPVGRSRRRADGRQFAEDSIVTLQRLGYPSAYRSWIRYPRFPARQPLRTLIRRYGVRSALLRWRRPPARGFGRFLFENAEPNAILLALLDIQPGRRGTCPKIRFVWWRSRGALKKRLENVRKIPDGNARYSEARRLVRYFVECRRPLSYRTKYNLACYLASRRKLDECDKQHAFDYLKEALEDAPPYEAARLAAGVRFDPTLTSLRRDPRLRELLARYC